MREADTFTVSGLLRKTLKLKENQIQLPTSHFQDFYGCLTPAVSVEIGFWLVCRPSKDNTETAVRSKNVCSVEVHAEFSALKLLSFKTAPCSPSEAVGVSA